ncbi:MAG: hypothetical protein ABEJ59_05295 [Halanaeroarchaeum sp.]
MAMTSGSVPFAIDGPSLSPVHDAVASGPSAIELVALAVGLAMVLVGVAGVLAYVRDADARIERELRELAAERDAYREFAERVSALRVTQGTTAMATPQTVQTAHEPGPPVEAVESAFEETVMAVDHYERTYGEPWLAHLQAELAPEIAATLAETAVVNAPLKRALEQRALEAAGKRDDLLALLSTERAAVADAEDSLATIQKRLEALDDGPLSERSFDDLAGTHDALDDLSTDVQEVASRRQRQIHRETRSGRFDAENLTVQEYLYGSLPAAYPVLDATVQLADRIDAAKRRVRTALTATV